MLRIASWSIVLAVCALLAWQSWYFAQVLTLTGDAPTNSRFMKAEADRLRALGREGRLRHEWVRYADISDELKRAVVMAEDARFVEHWGIDWGAIQRAWMSNLSRDEIAFGGSTITMQLAKNLYLTGQRSYWRKAQEMVIAMMLEAVLDKRRIFELYLNLAQWGDGLFGAQAAAQRYFGIDAHGLSTDQAAWLAAMLPRPAWFDRHRDSPWLASRAASIERFVSVARIP